MGLRPNSVQGHSNSTALGAAAENDTRTEENTDCPSRNVLLAQKPHALTSTGHQKTTEKHPLLLIPLFLLMILPICTEDYF